MLLDNISLPSSTKVFGPKFEVKGFLNKNEISNKLKDSNLTQFMEQEAVLVIINDAHRSTPSNVILRRMMINGEKTNTKITENISKIILATGTHPAPEEENLKDLFSDLFNIFSDKIVVHDCRADDLIDLGPTKRGTQILVNPILSQYKNVIVINSVEPHYFAGFTGGIKSIIPGLAGFITVEQNHSWAMDENSGPTKLKNNPVQLDLIEATSKVIEKFKLNVLAIQLVSQGKQIFDIFIGDLETAYRNAVELAMEMFSYNIKDRFDVIVSFVESPLNKSLYQAQKGIENVIQALKKGGEIILVAACNEGMGSDAFYKTIKEYEKPSDILAKFSRKLYKFGDHKVYNFARTAEFYKLILITDMSMLLVSTVFADKLDILDLEDKLLTYSKLGKSIAIVLDSGMVVLTV